MQARVQSVADVLDASPGIVVTEIARDGTTLVIRGLRDPLAAHPASLAGEAGWDGVVDSQFRPFMSLEPGLVLGRAEAALVPPATVNLTLEDTTLAITGIAPSSWVDLLPA